MQKAKKVPNIEYTVNTDDVLSETVTLSSSESLPSLDAPPEPKTIGSGIVTSLLGKGGAAVIYEIWNPKLEIHRAVKLWRPGLSEKIVERFENEIKITAKLRHPNIVEIHGVGEWNGLPFIEIEKIDGYSLKDVLLTRNGAIPTPVSIAIGICICRALTYAHNHEYTLGDKNFKGVIHCDIKPANIMIAKNGFVKLTDFGIALPLNTALSSEKNKITGSLQYMSPEQLQSRDIDMRTDIFSLGIVLYEMFSGVKAFPAATLETLIEKRKFQDVVPLNTLCKKVSPRVISIVHKCIEIDPGNRYHSAAEVLHDLEKMYYKYTTDHPESLINSFLKGDFISNKFQKSSIYVIVLKIFTGLTLLISIVLAALYFSKKTDLIDKKINIATPDVRIEQPVIVAVPLVGKDTLTEVDDQKSIHTVDSRKVTDKEKIKKSSVASTTLVRRAVPSIQTRGGGADSAMSKLSPAPKTVELDSENFIIDKLLKAAHEHDFTSVERIFSEFPVNDAEYYLVYAGFQIERGNFNLAKQYAIKAIQTQSKRLDPDQVRTRSFYLKAKAITSEFNVHPDRMKGQAAMEAWYDVKVHYRTDTNTPEFSEADREIRRISAEIQK